MYVSTDFATKRELKQAVLAGLPIVAYSPIMQTLAINGRETVVGPWHPDRTAKAWMAHVEVRDMRIIAVH